MDVVAGDDGFRLAVHWIIWHGWGVMDAFAGLGDAGAASLRAVAPGIAEALITTAAGLFAAIPAVIAYNYYLGGIRGLQRGWMVLRRSLSRRLRRFTARSSDGCRKS